MTHRLANAAAHVPCSFPVLHCTYVCIRIRETVTVSPAYVGMRAIYVCKCNVLLQSTLVYAGSHADRINYDVYVFF